MAKATMKEAEKPLSEVYRLAALEWGDMYSAWYTMSEGKTTMLAKLKQMLIDGDNRLAENKAERLAKNLPEWVGYLKTTSELHHAALRLRAYKESVEMRYHEKQSQDASARKERNLY